MEAARVELLKSMPIFGGVNEDTLTFLLASCPTRTVSAGDYFFHEDDDGNAMFVLESGQAAILKSWQGQDHHLYTMQPGDCFGEMAVMDMGARSASARAVEDCTAIEISAGNLHKVYAHDLKQFALIQMNMGREVCRRLRDADQKLFSAHMESQD